MNPAHVSCNTDDPPFSSQLGLFWSTTSRANAPALQKQIDHLSSFTPPPRPTTAVRGRSASKAAPPPPTITATPTLSSFDLDSADELASRDLLLGVLYRSLGSHAPARSHLQAVIDAAGTLLEEKWIVPFAALELAILDCQETDVEAKALGEDKAAVKALWKVKARTAERLIETVFSLPEYDLKSR